MPAIDRQRREVGNSIHRAFIDVTTSLMLAEQPAVGISRIEGEIASRLLHFSDLRAIPVVFRNDGALCALNPTDVARIFSARSRVRSLQARFRVPQGGAVLDGGTRASRLLSLTQQAAARFRRRTAAGMHRVARASAARTPYTVREDVRAILAHSRRILKAAASRGTASAVAPVSAAERGDQATLRDEIMPALRMVVHPGPGDVLWTGGLYSSFVPLRAIAELRARTGLSVVSTCHDLIRITHPQFNPPSMNSEAFAADTVAMLDASDLVLAVSEATRGELLAFAQRAGRTAPNVGALRLGSDFMPREIQPDLRIPSVSHEFSPRAFALAVGTVEPRKNYRLLVRIWEHLAADPAFPLDLVIVGRPGFDADDSLAEIECSPLFGSRIRWLEFCPDEALRRLYETCHLVLCPTFIDGWGLPVTEALAYGRHVIASDRGAIPEASRGLAQLLDPDDEQSWLAAITEAAAAPRRDNLPPNSATWDMAAATVADALRKFKALEDAD